jgi:hypothetical protein
VQVRALGTKEAAVAGLAIVDNLKVFAPETGDGFTLRILSDDADLDELNTGAKKGRWPRPAGVAR